MNDKKYKGISGATVVVFIAVIFFCAMDDEPCTDARAGDNFYSV